MIDGFELQEHLGTGGMAQLWAVAREGDPTPLVMKIPLLIDSDDPLPIVCFETEQMIMPRLSGAHVPRFVATGPLEPMPYIVMERIPGESLKARLDEVPLPWPEVVAIGAKVAHALHDLHRQHVIHLDMKPSNVMIRESGEAVLIDYGFARHERLPDLLAEEFREPFGTTPYMAPEQVLQDRADPRSDLFALGVMLYFFVTGERPFGNPRGGQIRRRLWRVPVPPRALQARLPALAAGDHPALPGGRSAGPLCHRGAARARPGEPGSGEADRARRAPGAGQRHEDLPPLAQGPQGAAPRDAQHRGPALPGARSCSPPSISRRAARTWPIPCA